MLGSGHNRLTDALFRPAVSTASNLVSVAVTFLAVPKNYMAVTQVSAISREMTVSKHM